MMGEDIYTPKISVILPVYNGEKYLKEAIESILNQTFKDFELLIINDASKDSTENIILSYSDSRIIYIKNEENLGLIKTLNKGLGLAKGELIARMDQDDIAMPTRFQKQVSVFDNNPEIGVCGTWFTLFGENSEKKIIKHPENPENIKIALLWYSSLGHPTVMLRKSAVGELRYNEEFQAAEDYEFWTRLSRITKLYNIQESLLDYRFHQTNMSVLEGSDQNLNSKKVVVKQLKYIGLQTNEENIQSCENLFCRYNRQYSTADLKKIITFANELEAKNSLQKFYNEILLKETIDVNLFELFEKTKKNNISLIPFLLKNKKVILVRKGFRYNIKLIAKMILRK